MLCLQVINEMGWGEHFLLFIHITVVLFIGHLQVTDLLVLQKSWILHSIGHHPPRLIPMDLHWLTGMVPFQKLALGLLHFEFKLTPFK